MIYIWRILDTFFRFDASYHYLYMSRIADDIFYGKVKGPMWQIGSSLQSTTSVCGSVPKDWLWSYMEIRKHQEHLPSSVHTGVMAEKNLGYQRNHKGWMISSIHPFWYQQLSLFVRGFLRLRTRNKNCLTRPFWLSDLGKDRIGAGRILGIHQTFSTSSIRLQRTLWNTLELVSFHVLKSLEESHKPLRQHLWQVDRYIYRICICI